MQQHRYRIAVHFADDAVMGRVGNINNDEVLACGGAQGNLRGGEVLRHPMIAPAHVAHDVFFFQIIQQLAGGGHVAEGIPVLKGKLVGGALEVT